MRYTVDHDGFVLPVNVRIWCLPGKKQQACICGGRFLFLVLGGGSGCFVGVVLSLMHPRGAVDD